MLDEFREDIINVRDTKKAISINEASAVIVVLHYIKSVIHIFKEHQLFNASNKKKLRTKLEHLFNSVAREQYLFTNQRINDIQMELTRIARIAHLWKIEDVYAFKKALANDELRKIHEEISTKLFSLTKYSTDQDTHIEKLLQELGNKVNIALSSTEFERKQIVKAMGLKQGHWFKCPNGHIYAIGECGRPTEQGKCYECGEGIGGTSHQLLPTNSFAGEMDRAHYPVYSDDANLGNNQMDELN